MRVPAFLVGILLTGSACQLSKPEKAPSHEVLPTEAPDTASTYSIEPLSDADVKWSQGMAFDSQDRLFVVDKEGSRILMLRDGKVVEIVGRLGQAPGEFLRPAGLSYSNGRLFISDQGNYRIQILKTDGTPISVFLVSFAPGYLAGDVDGSVLVNNPKGGGLFDLYDQSGKLVARYGSQLTAGEAYPNRRALNRTSLNRAFILNNDEGVYVVFQFVPIVQKWTVQGRLLWTVRLVGEEIDTLVAGLFGDKDGKTYSVKSTEGEPSLSLIVSASCLASTGDVLLALSDQTLIRLSPDGSTAEKIRPEGDSRKTFIAMAEHGDRLYFASESRLFYTRERLSTISGERDSESEGVPQ